jgi:hypothetical protein
MKLPGTRSRHTEYSQSRPQVLATAAKRYAAGNTARRVALGIRPATFCLDLCKGLTGDDYIECIRRC